MMLPRSLRRPFDRLHLHRLPLFTWLTLGVLALALVPPSHGAISRTAAAQAADPATSSPPPPSQPSQSGTAGGARSTRSQPASAADDSAVDPAQVAAIAKELNCPLCQGYSLLDCPLQVCAQMRQLIADRLRDGWTPAEVRAQFVADYGPQILSAPPAQGIGLAAWLTPVLAVVAGLALLAWRRRGAAPEPAKGPLLALPTAAVTHGAGAADLARPGPGEGLDAEEQLRRHRLEGLLREDDA